MFIKGRLLRYKRGLKRRFHPRAFLYDYYCRKNPDTPLTVAIESGVKARIWPGDEIGKPIYIGGIFEESEIKFMKGILGPGMVFFDIGANMGFYSLIGAKAVGINGHVHCFEPSPRMFGELQYNVNLNGFNNIRMNRAAFGEKVGTACLSRQERGKEVYGRITDIGKTEGNYDEVEVDTLDRYIENAGVEKIDLIKIDVEGAELQVFKGARNILSKPDAPIIIFEMEERHARKFNYTCKEAVDFLRGLGYKIYSITDGLMPIEEGFAFNTHITNFAAVKTAHSSIFQD